jgi:hypothetical protein
MLSSVRDWVVLFNYSVWAGRFDGRDSRGRLLMRDRDDFREF